MGGPSSVGISIQTTSYNTSLGQHLDAKTEKKNASKVDFGQSVNKINRKRKGELQHDKEAKRAKITSSDDINMLSTHSTISRDEGEALRGNDQNTSVFSSNPEKALHAPDVPINEELISVAVESLKDLFEKNQKMSNADTNFGALQQSANLQDSKSQDVAITTMTSEDIKSENLGNLKFMNEDTKTQDTMTPMMGKKTIKGKTSDLKSVVDELLLAEKNVGDNSTQNDKTLEITKQAREGHARTLSVKQKSSRSKQQAKRSRMKKKTKSQIVNDNEDVSETVEELDVTISVNNESGYESMAEHSDSEFSSKSKANISNKDAYSSEEGEVVKNIAGLIMDVSKTIEGMAKHIAEDIKHIAAIDFEKLVKNQGGKANKKTNNSMHATSFLPQPPSLAEALRITGDALEATTTSGNSANGHLQNGSTSTKQPFANNAFDSNSQLTNQAVLLMIVKLIVDSENKTNQVMVSIKGIEARAIAENFRTQEQETYEARDKAFAVAIVSGAVAAVMGFGLALASGASELKGLKAGNMKDLGELENAEGNANVMFEENETRIGSDSTMSGHEDSTLGSTAASEASEASEAEGGGGIAAASNDGNTSNTAASEGSDASSGYGTDDENPERTTAQRKKRKENLEKDEKYKQDEKNHKRDLDEKSKIQAKELKKVQKDAEKATRVFNITQQVHMVQQAFGSLLGAGKDYIDRSFSALSSENEAIRKDDNYLESTAETVSQNTRSMIEKILQAYNDIYSAITNSLNKLIG